jgi:hypothetical protein
MSYISDKIFVASPCFTQDRITKTSYIVYSGKKVALGATMIQCGITELATLELRARNQSDLLSRSKIGGHLVRYKCKGGSLGFTVIQGLPIKTTETFGNVKGAIAKRLKVAPYFLRFTHNEQPFELAVSQTLDADTLEGIGLGATSSLDLVVELQNQIEIEATVDAGLGKGETKTKLLYPFPSWADSASQSGRHRALPFA